MTRQDMNNIIIQHISAEIRDKPDVQDRITSVFNKWFQALVQMATPPPVPTEEEVTE